MHVAQYRGLRDLVMVDVGGGGLRVRPKGQIRGFIVVLLLLVVIILTVLLE